MIKNPDNKLVPIRAQKICNIHFKGQIASPMAEGLMSVQGNLCFVVYRSKVKEKAVPAWKGAGLLGKTCPVPEIFPGL